MTPTREPSLPSRLRRRRWLTLGLAITTCVLVGGCGSGDNSTEASGVEQSTASSGPSAADPVSSTTTPTSDSGGTEAGDACDIVSDEVAAEVLGIEIQRREPHTDATYKTLSCIKGTERATDMSKVSYVSVSILPGAGSMLLDQASSEAGSVPVSGLGDEAVYLPGTGALLISDGVDGVQVQVVKAGKPAEQQDAVTVAQDVLERLG
jgi:hypothetical protein